MAKINVSVSSSSSKPNVTVSKGPVGPQGEQGVQGEAGPQGPAGAVSNLESISNVQIPSLEDGGYIENPAEGGFFQNALVYDHQNTRWTTFLGASGNIETSANKSASPPPNNSWTDPIITLDLNETTSVASTRLALNNSNYIPNDVNLYVNGTSRFNGPLEIASGGSTVYTLPSSDGTANQILKTDGSGAISFTGDYLTKSTADVITATKRFNAQQDFLGGVNITNGASINGYTLPTSDGTAGQFLKTDGSGNISFAVASSLALGTTSTTALAGNTTTISTTQASEIAANTLKVGITSTQASEIAANTLKVGITTQQASEIVANTAKTDTNVANTSLTLDDNRTLDLNGNDLIIDPKGGEFQINDSSGLPSTAEIAIAQGNVDIAGTQVSINGIDYPAVDGFAGQFLKTDGSGNLSFSNVAQSIDGLTDVDTTTTAPADGQALVWDDTANNFVPGDSFSQSDFDTAFGNKNLSNLGDVDSSLPSDSSVLAWDATNNYWEPRAASSGGNTSYVVYATARTNTNGTTDVINGMTVSRSTTGTYNYTFTTALSDANYVVTTTPVGYPSTDANIYVDSFSTTGFTVYGTSGDNGTSTDPLVDREHCVTVFSSQTSGGGFVMRGDDGEQGPSGTTYDVVTLTGSTTLSSAHTTKYLVVDSASNCNITVPSTASYDANAEFVIEQRGAGVVTIVAASGVTINTSETLVSGGQYAVMGLKRTASNVYTLTGERQAS